MSGIVYVDRRSYANRTAGGLWERWDDASPRWLSWLAPLTNAVAQANLRHRLASRDTPGDTPRVVSIGALASGGSGKTPVVAALAHELTVRGWSVALVTRGYGSAVSGPCRVRPDEARCGDEARMLSACLPDCVVVQSRDRRDGLAWLRENAPETGIVVLEDGHQCAGAGRHLDVIILDRWRLVGRGVVPEVGRRLPWGPYREGLAGATRAGLWLVPLAADEVLPETEGSGPTVLGFRRLSTLADGMAMTASSPYGVVSGIAKPADFEIACRDLVGHDPRVAVRFDDHVAYRPDQLADIFAAGERAGVERWLTTAKDHVKLAGIWPEATPPLIVVELELTWPGETSLAEAVLSRLEA
jgi:tetraacyldisaccharide 4'-kinase